MVDEGYDIDGGGANSDHLGARTWRGRTASCLADVVDEKVGRVDCLLNQNRIRNIRSFNLVTRLFHRQSVHEVPLEQPPPYDSKRGIDVPDFIELPSNQRPLAGIQK